MTTDELANLLGHTPSSIGLIERGERGATAYTLYKLTEIFDVSSDDFLRGGEPKLKRSPIREKLTGLMSDFTDEEVKFITHVVSGVRDKRNSGA